jgi:hypothetical protein
MKRWIGVCLAVVLVLGLAPPAWAATAGFQKVRLNSDATRLKARVALSGFSPTFGGTFQVTLVVRNTLTGEQRVGSGTVIPGENFSGPSSVEVVFQKLKLNTALTRVKARVALSPFTAPPDSDFLIALIVRNNTNGEQAVGSTLVKAGEDTEDDDDID